MTLSRYSGRRRTPASLRTLNLNQEQSAGTSTAENPAGRGAGGGTPVATSSRYSGNRRHRATLRTLSVFDPPAELFVPVVEQSDPYPVLFL